MPIASETIDWSPVEIIGAERDSRWLVLCDHAHNTIPPWIPDRSLGLKTSDLERHIAFDIGASGTALRLGQQLDAPVVLSNFSRLVVDPNRGPDDPTLVRRIYDESIIPGNRHMSPDDFAHRMASCYYPYHEAVAEMAARNPDTVIVSIHTFTPQLRHKAPRPWHVGLLFADDRRLSDPLAKALQQEAGLVVGLNEPYSGYLSGDTIDQHALRFGRQNTLIELRNDLVSRKAGQIEWANRLAEYLPLALMDAEQENGD